MWSVHCSACTDVWNKVCENARYSASITDLCHHIQPIYPISELLCFLISVSASVPEIPHMSGPNQNLQRLTWSVSHLLSNFASVATIIKQHFTKNIKPKISPNIQCCDANFKGFIWHLNSVLSAPQTHCTALHRAALFKVYAKLPEQS